MRRVRRCTRNTPTVTRWLPLHTISNRSALSGYPNPGKDSSHQSLKSGTVTFLFPGLLRMLRQEQESKLVLAAPSAPCVITPRYSLMVIVRRLLAALDHMPGPNEPQDSGHGGLSGCVEAPECRKREQKVRAAVPV